MTEVIIGTTESDAWKDALYREMETLRLELEREIADFLVDQIRQYPDAERALRQISIRIRGGDW